MKKSYYVLLVAALACLQPSCKKEIDGLGISTGEVESVTMQAKDLLYSDLNQPSKTSLSFNNNAAEFSWKSTDVVGVFPDEGTQVRFPIADGHVEEGTATSEAHFTGCGWAVKKQHSYMAYYPFVPDMNMDKTAIPVTFANQIQKGNANSDHIEVFDYMAAALQEPTKTGEIAFHFEHLGCLFEFVVRAPKAAEYTSLSLSSNGQFIIDGQYDLTVGVPAIEAVSTSNELVLSLEDIQTTEADEELRLYMMMAPVDLTGQDIIVKLKGPHAEFEVNLGPGTNFRAGRFYRPSLSGIQGGDIILLEDGTAFCHDVKTLANGEDFPADKNDYMIRTIRFETDNSNIPEGTPGKDFCDVSAADSPAPIYAIWDVNTRTITIRTSTHYVYSSRYADGMLSNMKKLADVNFEGFSSTNMENSSNFFNGCETLTSIDLTSWDTSSLTTLDGMFWDCSSLESVVGFKPVCPVRVKTMCWGCSRLQSFDMSDWKLQGEADWCFRNCYALESVNLTNVNTTQLGAYWGMFFTCPSLTSLDISSFDFSNSELVGGMFAGCSGLESLTIGDTFGSRYVRSYEGVFQGCNKLRSIDFSKIQVYDVEIFRSMFAGCESLESVDVAGWVTTYTTDIANMFNGCQSLESIDLSSWNTTAVVDFSGLFANCSSLESLDIRPLSTVAVTSMREMFNGCSSLKSVDLSAMETSNVTYMGGMFRGCESLSSLDLSKFDTDKLAEVQEMFFGCSNLETLDLTGFNTSRVGNFEAMFRFCEKLREIKGIEDFDTHFADNLSMMFEGCKSLAGSLDLSKWRTNQMSSCTGMFIDCEKLQSIDISGFNTEHVSSAPHSMFRDCNSLVTLKLGGNFMQPLAFGDNHLSNIRVYTSRDFMDTLKNTSECYGFWYNNNFYDFQTSTLMKAAGSETEL